MESNSRFTATDAEQIEEHLLPLVGRFRVRPARGNRFHVAITARALTQLGIFTVAADSIRVDIEPPLPFLGVNLPLGKPFSANEGKQLLPFQNDAHVVSPHRPMALETRTACRVLAVCAPYQSMRDYAARLNGNGGALESEVTARLPVSTPQALALGRSLAELWSELGRRDDGTGPELSVAELEDKVIANLALAATGAGETPRCGCDAQQARRGLAEAEDYLCAHLQSPISRAELAARTGVSIRTLSRWFMRRHRVGPMAFLKTRRLNAAYRELLGSEPNATTVTETATRYGFLHLGKFAMEYRRVFRESPSETLAR